MPRIDARLAILIAVLLALVVAPATARSQATQGTPAASFRLCNQTGGPVEVAKALNVATKGNPADITSEGWYSFATGECATLWSGKLAHRYYLLYAQNKKTNREWKGDIPICVDRQPFTIRKGLCDANQYRRLFFQVDTGESESYTFNLKP